MMTKEERITRVTAREAALLRAQGKTDWARQEAMTGEEIEADIDAEEIGMVVDWSTVMVGVPQPKATVNMRIDRDVLDFFKQGGRGNQTRINAVLRGYMQAQTKG
jgi:uncharacterized protein (DUF4415 family)